MELDRRVRTLRCPSNGRGRLKFSSSYGSVFCVGGMMNVFLLGCFNPDDRSWRSVTKVHGHDDETLKALQVIFLVFLISGFSVISLQKNNVCITVD